jgi:hypothetical protein
MEKMKMASRKPRTSKASRQLQGAGEFAGPDAAKEAIEKIAQAKVAAETEAEQDKKKGDNGGPIMDEEAWKRAVTQLIAEQIDIERMMEQVAEARGRISSIRKVAKSCGVDWDVVKIYATYQKRIRKGEMGAVVTEQRRLGTLMRVMGSPLYTQWNLFPEAPEEGTQPNGNGAMDAELQGQAAYRNSEPLTNNPFLQGTVENVDWSNGWRNAQSANARKMAPGASAEAAAGEATKLN